MGPAAPQRAYEPRPHPNRTRRTRRRPPRRHQPRRNRPRRHRPLRTPRPRPRRRTRHHPRGRSVMSDYLDTWPDDGPVLVRKLPVVVQAYRFNGDNGPDIVTWAGIDQDGEPVATWSRYDGLVINTLDG